MKAGWTWWTKADVGGNGSWVESGRWVEFGQMQTNVDQFQM